jgi:transposase
MCSRRTRSAGKKRALRRRAHGLPARTALLAEDETDLRLFPPLRAGWAERGAAAPVPISGANAKRVLFGAMNLRTGRRLFQAARHGRGADFRSFLGLVRDRYRGRGVALLLDEDSGHTAAASRRAADDLGIELLWLPTRSPHLNPMDHLWRHAKQAVCANRQYRTIDEEVQRFLWYLEGLTADQALNKAGVFADDFWLDL